MEATLTVRPGNGNEVERSRTARTIPTGCRAPTYAYMLFKLVLSALFLLTPSMLLGQSSWYPFTVPWSDSSKSFTDASDLLLDYPGQDPATVIDSRGFLRAAADGHFYFEKTGRRVRFWGVNFTFNANYPPCPDEPLRSGEYPDQHVSDKVAAHLAKLGVNVVRFHHMDYYAAPNGIWDPKEYPNNTQHLDAGQLRRFDYLVYQLRKHGIYTNINLKVARHFGPGDGIDPGDIFKGNLSFFQAVSHWNPRMIELQKDYARQLLTHRNPYSGLTYVEDPAVAFVEIANEDSLFGNLTWDGGLNYVPSVDGCLPERYSRELDVLFNSWLSGRYRGRADLDAAWQASGTVGDTSNRIRNGGFEDGMSGWTVQQLGSAKAAAKVEAGTGSNGSAALRVDVTSDGTNWHVQAFQNGHSITKDRMYEFSFRARASSAVDIGIDVMKGADPWQNYGLSKTVRLGTGWQKVTAQFRANETDTSTVRPTFELGTQTATIWIDDVEFREAAPKGLQADEDPELGTVRRPMKSELGGYSNQRVIDLFRFYTEVDETYFVGMRAYIKENLGSRAMVTGTAPWWGFLGDTATQSRMDYVDTHYYWDHPSWPGVPAWSATGWRITNQPWINSIDQFAGIPAQAVEGKPLVLSEFNHVFPNRYALEGPLLVALIGNLQDWDGIYMFDYAGSTSAFDDSYTTSFFSMAGNPVKTAQMPVASRIFLSRQNSAAPRLLAVELNRSELALAYAQGLVDARRFLGAKGLPSAAYLQARLRVRTFERATPTPIAFQVPDGDVASGGRELVWARSASPRTSMVINGPGIQGDIGFIKGVKRDHGDWDYEVSGDSPDHLAVILQSRDGGALRETRHMMLSVWAEHQNTGMGWNSDQTSVDNRWGSSPTTVRAAKVTLRFRFPGARGLRLWALGETGSRKAELTQQKSEGMVLSEIDTARDGAVCYEIEVNEASSSPELAVSSPGTFQLYTEASGEQLQVGWAEVQNKTGVPLRLASLLEYSSRGVLTSLVRLPASPETLLSRAPVIRTRYVDTAVALLNRQGSTITAGMKLRRADGTLEGGAKTVSLAPGASTAFFVREKFDVPDGFEGLLEVNGSSPLHVITLRSIVNAAGDFALTPYPAESSPAGPLFLPHLVSDASYSTDLLFWNSQLQPLVARLDFFGPDGRTWTAGLNPASLEIRLEPGQFRRVSFPLSDNSPFYGYARLTLTSGPALPASTAVITRWEGGAPVSEAGLPATPTVTDVQVIAAERPNQQTGLALLNTSTAVVTVECEISGTEQTLPNSSRTTISLQPGEKRAFFLNQVVSELPRYLTGILRIRASGPIAALALLGLNNERGNFLISALTGEPGFGALDPEGAAVLPRLAVGAGYRTLFLIFPEASGTSQGLIRFFDTGGVALPLFFR